MYHQLLKGLNVHICLSNTFDFIVHSITLTAPIIVTDYFIKKPLNNEIMANVCALPVALTLFLFTKMPA